MGDIDKARPEIPVYRKDRKLMQMAINKTYAEILAFLVEYLYGADVNVSQAKIDKQLSTYVRRLQQDTATYVSETVRKAHLDGRTNQIKGMLAGLSAIELNQFIAEQTKKAGTVVDADVEMSREDALKFILSQSDYTVDQNVNALVIETYSDILEATENTLPNIKKVVRDSVRDIVQLNSLNAENYGSQADQLKKQLKERLTKKGLRSRFIKEGFIGIVDKGGRRWDVGTYSDMVIKTKLSQAYTDGVKREGVDLEMDLAVISDHGAKDDCGKWEGVVVSLTGKTAGYPTLKEAKATNEVFHPNCQHTVHLIRGVDQLSDRDRKTAGKQSSKLGDYKKRMKRTRI